MLTQEQSNRLKEYFPVRSHEFLNGNTYISEEAITNRLDEVDPSWTWELIQEYTRDKQCIAVGRMTVCGVSRDGVGMQPTRITKKDGTEIDGTEPEKSAATDALKRAARLFGIGRYILEMGRAVTDYRTLEQWLDRQGAKTAPKSNVEGENSGDEGSQDEPPAKRPVDRLNNGNGKKTIAPPETSALVLKNWSNSFQQLMMRPELIEAIPQNNHRANAINELYNAGAFEGADLSQAIESVIHRNDGKLSKAS